MKNVTDYLKWDYYCTFYEEQDVERRYAFAYWSHYGILSGPYSVWAVKEILSTAPLWHNRSRLLQHEKSQPPRKCAS